MLSMLRERVLGSEHGFVGSGSASPSHSKDPGAQEGAALEAAGPSEAALALNRADAETWNSASREKQWGFGSGTRAISGSILCGVLPGCGLSKTTFEEFASGVNVALDTVGREAQVTLPYGAEVDAILFRRYRRFPRKRNKNVE